MPAKSSNLTITRSHHTVIPQAETLLSIRTQPNAVCHLFHDESKSQRLQLDADDNGIVRFHARALKDWKPIEVHIEHTREDGSQTRHTLVLRADGEHGVPVTPNEVSAPPAGSLRPPLEGDPLLLSKQELVARGYPPRPDPKRSPAHYARWHRNASQPYTMVSPRRAAHPGVSFAQSTPKLEESFPTLPLPPPHSGLTLSAPTLPLPPPLARPMFNANSNTWSGAYLTRPVKQFYSIYADWHVPGVIALPNAPPYSAAAEWIGLDNSGTDLYQSGTDSECSYVAGWGWTFTNYWMWIETLPFAPWAVPNFTVAPGDSVSVDIFVADEYGTTWFKDGTWGGLTARDNSVWFMLYNNTRSLSFWGTLPTAAESINGLSSTPFTGSTAEFIVERPAYNGSTAPLANFLFAAMQYCGYGDSQYGDQTFPLGADGSQPFDGNLAYLNMQNSTSKDLLDITISLPDPTSTGSEILWVWTNYQ
jgi:hypothetical protein